MSAPTFDDRDGYIWMNGSLMPWRGAKVHVLTHALHYGSCVFEGQRAYRGKVFKLQEHTERLFASAAILDMKIPFTPAEIDTATYETIRANGLSDCYVRPLAWRGSEMMGSRRRPPRSTWPLPCGHGLRISRRRNA